MCKVIALLSVFVVAACIMPASPASAKVLAFQATEAENSGLFLADPDTGVRTGIGPTDVPYLRALDISPVDGKLYGLGYSSGAAGTSLYRLDMPTGLATEVVSGVASGGYVINNMAFAPDGTLYANVGYSYQTAQGDLLLKIDVASGAVTTVGSLAPYHQMTGFAIDENGVGIGWDRGANWLFSIDLADASTASLGYLSEQFGALDFGPDGKLYGWATIGGWIDRIDVAALTVTRMGLGSGIDSIGSLAMFAALPGDANLDGKVSVGDLGILAANYGKTSNATWLQGDFNGDMAVSVGDLGILAANYGSGAIPEPITVSLLSLGVLALRRRR